MNTDFRILWFEDNDVWYDSIKTEIEYYLIDLNFDPHIDRYKYIQTDDIINSVKNNKYDLVLADLKLDKKHKGGDAIKLIREYQILADALFYSTDGVDKIKESIGNETLEGIYLSTRDDIFLLEKAKKLIDKLIKRSEDIVNVRGLLMDNVSEFDEKLKDAIRKFLSIASGDQRKAINNYAFEKVNHFYDDQIKRITELGCDDFIIKSIDKSFVLDSYKLSMIVNKIFKKYYPEYKEMKKFHEKYNKLILTERNQLAHAKKEPEDNGLFYFSKEDGERIIYDSNKCSEIRKNLNFYHSLLDQIIDEIN